MAGYLNRSLRIKNKSMKSLTVILFLIISLSSFAQDKIIKKNLEEIHCKVTEIGADEIKYFYKDSPNLIFGIDKALVDRIEFATGELIKVEDNTMQNPEYYVNQSKNALKINFLSPLFGTTELVYERSINPGKSWEVALGLVGVGNDIANVNPSGLYGKFAYKFMRDPDFYFYRMHYSHLLKGAYFAPEIALRRVGFDRYNFDYYYDQYGNYHSSNIKERKNQTTLALMLKLGKQWVIDDSFLIDTYLGVGYGIGADDLEGLPYGFIVAPDDFPIAFSSGIRIGWVFGK